MATNVGHKTQDLKRTASEFTGLQASQHNSGDSLKSQNHGFQQSLKRVNLYILEEPCEYIIIQTFSLDHLNLNQE